MTVTARLTLAETRLMLERGKLCAGDITRPVLHGLHITIAGGHVRAEASDGFALMIHRIDADDVNGNANVILDYDDIGAMLKALPRATKKTASDPVELSIDPQGSGRIRIGELERQGVAGSFPNLEQLIPRGIGDDQPPVEQIAVGARLLERAGKLARIADVSGFDASGVVRFNMPASAKQPITLTFRDSKRSCALVVIMPMFVEARGVAEAVADVLHEAPEPVANAS